MTVPESAPIAGSRVGRYVIIREVAQGTFGPLYIAEREVGDGVQHGLARVVTLPPGLPAQDEQTLADAIWDSTNLAHELVLRVADVVTGKGWLTLIHEHSEGSLLEFLQTCARESGAPFPAKVAARIALDVIEGLEQSRDHCASAGIPWRPGSVAPGSLLLGPDGRMRALDGQITAAALRVPALRAQPAAAAFAAPEMLDDAREPSERSDVFSIGVLLWELLTGRTLFGDQANALDLGQKFKIPKITHSLPEGIKVPQGLVHAVHTALELEPLKRQASLRELAVAIVMGVEEVATYEQVIEFTDAILEPRSADDSQSDVDSLAQSLQQEMPVEQAPVPQALPTEQFAVPELAHAQPTPIPDVPLFNSAPAPVIPPIEQPRATPIPSEPNAQGTVEPLLAPRDKLDTLPGQGSPRPLDIELRQSASPAPTPAGIGDPAPVPAVVEAQANLQSGPTASLQPTAQPFRLVSEEPEPYVPLAALPVQAVGEEELQRAESPRPVPARNWDETNDPSQIPGLPKKRTLQLSMGTIIFGFSTTVLAVIVIMLALQHSSTTTSKPTLKEAPTTSRASALESGSPTDLAAQQTEVSNTERATLDNGKESDAGMASPPGAKVDHHKRTARDQAKSSGKSSATEDEPPAGDSKAAGQSPNKHYIPNEL